MLSSCGASFETDYRIVIVVADSSQQTTSDLARIKVAGWQLVCWPEQLTDYTVHCEPEPMYSLLLTRHLLLDVRR